MGASHPIPPPTFGAQGLDDCEVVVVLDQVLETIVW
jgi:hypothetical protein